MNSQNQTSRDFLIIAILCAILFGFFLGNFPLQSPDAARYAEIPREMLVTHDFITPHLNGIKYFEKPPLFYWAQAISLKVFGINEFAANLPNALFAFGTCLLVYFVGRKLFVGRSGLLSSVVLATSILFFAMARVVTLDMALTFFMSGALFSFLLGTRAPPDKSRDYYFWSFYVFAALAVLTKGLIGLFLPGLIILIYIIIYHEWQNLKNYKILSGSIIFLAIAAPWHILVQMANPEFFHFYFFEQHLLRYLTPYAHRTHVWWFLPAVLLLGIYPWTAFLLQALKCNLPGVNFSRILFWKKTQSNNSQNFSNRSAIFLIIWAATIYVFYSFSSSQLAPYLLPLCPPLAIILGIYFNVVWDKPVAGLKNGFKAVAVINIILGIAIIIGINTAVNFTSEVYPTKDFYLAAFIILASGFVIFHFYRKTGTQAGFIAIVVSMSLFLLSINPFFAENNQHRSIKPLIMVLNEKAKPGDEIMSFGDYYQDLPFYTQKIITIVNANYSGELDFGIKHMDASKWVIPVNEFWQRWYGDKRVFMVISKNNYAKLQKAIATAKDKLAGPNRVANAARYDRLFLVSEYFDDVLLTNQKP